MLVPVAPALASGTAATSSWTLPAGSGDRLVVHRYPFQLALLDRAGRTIVSTVAGTGGLPADPPSLSGPMPEDPAGAAGAFPALGWLLGADRGVAEPVSYFQGNRLLGVRAGAVVAVTSVLSAIPLRGGWAFSLGTDAPGARPATLTVLELPSGGVRLHAAPPSGLPAVSSLVTLNSPPGEGLYGLGGRKDAFDQRGLLRYVWTEQENVGAGPFAPAVDPTLGPTYTFPNGAQATYFPQAVLFGSRGWGMWTYGSALAEVDLAHSLPSAVRWGVATPQLDFGLAGGGLTGASAAFTAQDGRAPAPPSWVYRPWVDVINQGEGDAAPNGSGFTGGARVRATALAIAAAAKRYGLPIGVIGMEGWQAVPGIASLAKSLRAQGFHLSAYWNFFTASTSAAYPAARGLFVRSTTGQDYPVVTNRGNVNYMLDFTNPATRAFWVSQVNRSCALGFSGWMEDYGEQVTQGMRFASGAAWSLVHNAYPVAYHADGRAAANACAARYPGLQPFFYVRSGYSMPAVGEPGVAAYTSGVFPGDETTDWSASSGLASVVPAMLNLALGGMYTFSTDVGGYLDLYTPRTTPELLARWIELAAFTPVLRIHNSTVHGSLYPWNAGPAVLAIYRKYALAKVRLAGLVNRLSVAAAKTGALGPVRPVVTIDDTPAGRAVGNEWLLGPSLLVAPVLVQGATSRSVYLPAGSHWRAVRVLGNGALQAYGQTLAGGRQVNAAAPLGVIPLYQRV